MMIVVCQCHTTTVVLNKVSAFTLHYFTNVLSLFFEPYFPPFRSSPSKYYYNYIFRLNSNAVKCKMVYCSTQKKELGFLPLNGFSF